MCILEDHAFYSFSYCFCMQKWEIMCLDNDYLIILPFCTYGFIFLSSIMLFVQRASILHGYCICRRTASRTHSRKEPGVIVHASCIKWDKLWSQLQLWSIRWVLLPKIPSTRGSKHRTGLCWGWLACCSCIWLDSSIYACVLTNWVMKLLLCYIYLVLEI